LLPLTLTYGDPDPTGGELVAGTYVQVRREFLIRETLDDETREQCEAFLDIDSPGRHATLRLSALSGDTWLFELAEAVEDEDVSGTIWATWTTETDAESHLLPVGGTTRCAYAVSSEGDVLTESREIEEGGYEVDLLSSYSAVENELTIFDGASYPASGEANCYRVDTFEKRP
jgi:hypothetical protein